MPTWKSRSTPAWPRSSRRRGGQDAEAGTPVEVSLHPERAARKDSPIESSVIEQAIYAYGERIADPDTLVDTVDQLARRPDTLAWVGMHHPSAIQVHQAADLFELHPLAVEDAIVAHQRPKIERYDETLFVVIRSAAYNDATESVDFGEIHLFIGPNFVLTMRHSTRPGLEPVRHRLEHAPDLLALGPEAVLYAVLDFIVDGYAPVVTGVEQDIEEIETQVFESDPAVSRRIYQLSHEVLELQVTTRRIRQIFASLEDGFESYHTDPELRRGLRDVADHATSVSDRVDGFRNTLTAILRLNATLVSQAQNEQMRHLSEVSNQQNEQMKKVSSWAAIIFAPTVISGVYGMNFDTLPEKHWILGYPFALLIMLLVSLALYRIFRARGWL